MSPQLLEALHKAGWYNGRMAGRAYKKFIKQLHDANFPVNAKAESILREFAGLVVETRIPWSFSGPPSERPLPPAVKELVTENFPVTPIAEGDSGLIAFIMIVASNGSVFTYCDSDDVPDLVGAIWGPWQTPLDALEDYMKIGEELPRFFGK